MTLAAAAGPLAGAMKMQEMWQAALLLKTAEPGDLNDWRLKLHKAFRDANPAGGKGALGDREDVGCATEVVDDLRDVRPDVSLERGDTVGQNGISIG